MRPYLSLHLGGSLIEINLGIDGQCQGCWLGMTFVGPNAAAVVFQIITRHRARMSAKMKFDE